ncbi:MAG: hypothetical protein KJ928_04290 [Candidatus Altiarchaeota archaeon]|nr:hypothetical protein [Candidatus Altiarchaeota archaeon]MBU4437390.1 hypothetical protein [Candidatus Altiarchaeota archaeon]
MDKKIITLLVILALAASNPAAGASVKGKVKDIGANYWKSGDLLSEEMLDAGRSIILLAAGYSFLIEATSDLASNITGHILRNPPVYSEGFRGMIGFFIGLIQPFYIIAIILTAFYIMFVSDSYVQRSRAKSMLAKLVVGLIITSFSLPLLWAFFGMSEAVTASILSQGMVDRAVEEYNAALWSSYKLLVFSLVLSNLQFANQFLKNLPKAAPPDGAGDTVNVEAFKNFVKTAKIKGDLRRSIPPLLLFGMLFVGMYMLISIRYVMVMIWALMFPLMVFFLSFNATRRIGRTMMEQTLLWTVLQTFYAITFTAVGAALTITPPHMYNAYAIQYSGSFEGVPQLLFHFSFFTGVACMVLYLGPIVLFNLFQKLFPP